jgi:23S rRNA (cytidine1920-2'-O)/16S rRNA (cytidine1409-2'-O)-methyltransferase
VAVETERIDKLVVARGIIRDLALAERMIYAGEVRVNGVLVDKPGTPVPVDATISLKEKPPFVSRGGEKLDAALEVFAVDVSNRVAADVGASTGGFTDCLLQRGAAKVYAIDVGYGQLAWTLRQDSRVVVMERVNARYLKSLPEAVSVLVSDVSFISLELIYETAVNWLTPGGDVVSLIKPQFEAPPEDVAKGGVVRNSEVHRKVLVSVIEMMAKLGLELRGLMASPLIGPAGNVEFLGWWRLQVAGVDIDLWIDRALADAAALTAS